MIQTGTDPVFYGNALRFATPQEAQRSASDLMSRWMLVVDTRVDESDDPVNYKIDLTADPPILSAVDRSCTTVDVPDSI